MTQKTILNDAHRALGARMVDFGGWDMPLHYGSQVDEHHQVRRDAGMFDVSHMTVVDLEGPRTREFLRKLLANSVDKLRRPGKALYTCMLDANGGVIDDLIVYAMPDGSFRVIVNAGTAEKDTAWLRKHTQDAGGSVELAPRRDLAILAVQGPQARGIVAGLANGELPRRFRTRTLTVAGVDGVLVCGTGYTGEDG
ncbi:MAG TPA: glycine cleavage system aminomethyltransferase GcvT, partial [Xanthomonadaceae bacterium]|nr:glycine cleavage system aminomethyltransferase GcvT [Xanthomonadaceae bacterium]